MFSVDRGADVDHDISKAGGGVLGGGTEAIRAEIRRAMRDGRLAGRELPRSIPELMSELAAAEAAYQRAESCAHEMLERVLAPIEAGRAREAFSSRSYVTMIYECEDAQAAADAALEKLKAVESVAMAMLRRDGTLHLFCLR